MKFLAPEQHSRCALGAGPISVEYLRFGLDIGSDPRTLHLAVDQECDKYDGSEGATAGKYKVAFVRRVVVALPGHFFTFSPSSTSRHMASERFGQVVLLPAPIVKLFGHLGPNANQNARHSASLIAPYGL
jgi:hypothetical protein